MGTAVVWEGNIGSAPEFKEFPNGNKDPRRLCRLNVYFDNPVPKDDGYEDRGGFWANVEIWHANAEQYASLYQKGMRVVVQGRAIMDTWTNAEGEDQSALKVQASRVGILPHRIEQVVLGQSSNPSRQGAGQTPRASSGQQRPAEPDFDDDIPVF